MKELITLQFDSEVRQILGTPNFACGGIAKRLRELGIESKTKAEDEQATVIYWMLSLYTEHGDNWREEGDKILKSKD